MPTLESEVKALALRLQYFIPRLLRRYTDVCWVHRDDRLNPTRCGSAHACLHASTLCRLSAVNSEWEASLQVLC